MRLALKLMLFMAATLATLPCLAQPEKASGFSLNQFRIVYPAAGKKGITWSMTNNTDRTYLMQSWVRPMDFTSGLPAAGSDSKAPGDAIPLMVTPPLKRLDPGEQLTLRIRLTGMTLPQDRESVFYLSVKGIPSVPERASQTGGQLVLAVVNNMKLFYRPEGLPEGGVRNAAKQLRFSLQNDVLVVDNPTPFYIHFSQLTVGRKPLAADELRRLVPPKGQQRYPVSPEMRGAVEWQVLDEDSQRTALQRQAL